MASFVTTAECTEPIALPGNLPVDLFRQGSMYCIAVTTYSLARIKTTWLIERLRAGAPRRKRIASVGMSLLAAIFGRISMAHLFAAPARSRTIAVTELGTS